MSKRKKRKIIEKELDQIKSKLSISLKEFTLLVNSVLKKWKKEESYYEYIKDYIEITTYNHYKRYGSFISINKMLFLLSKYKGVNTDKVALRMHYSELIKKINRKVSTRIYRENLKKKSYFNEFLLKVVDYNKRGYISKDFADRCCIFFFGYTLEDISNNSIITSNIEAVEDLLHDAKYAFPEKLPAINILFISLISYEKNIPDDKIDKFFYPVDNLVIV